MAAGDNGWISEIFTEIEELGLDRKRENYLKKQVLAGNPTRSLGRLDAHPIEGVSNSDEKKDAGKTRPRMRGKLWNLPVENR